MKITIVLDTDDFNFIISDEGEANTSKEVRQLISLGRLAVADLQAKLDLMYNNVAALDKAIEESKAKTLELPPAKSVAERAAMEVAKKVNVAKKGRR